MRPVTQTVLHDPGSDIPGNCWQAVIASMLHLDIDDVPHFLLVEDQGGPHWFTNTLDFLAERGLTLSALALDDIPPGEPYIACGPAERGVSHVVIYQDGACIHDPHPSRAGLLSVRNAYRLRPVYATPPEGGIR